MNELLSGVYQELTLTITIIVIILLTFIAQWLVKRAFKRFEENSTQFKVDDPTNYRFLYYAIVALIYVTGIGFAIWNIPSLRHIAQSMLASAGILAIVLGFASQQALGNIVSGLFIVIFKPYRINDRISMRDTLRGVVEDINLRHTIIRNFENQRIVIPNSLISNEILINSNYNDDKICKLITIGISYGSDIDKAKQIMAEEVESHPLNIDNRKPEDIEKGTPRVLVRVIALSDSSVSIRAWAWASDPPNSFTMECDVIESVKKRFDREGVVIPFPQRTISYLEPAKSGAIQDETKPGEAGLKKEKR
ncbi:mechanosensitive ion channel family protein [Rhodohalobacter sp. SW132]|uniref:mechanosensitive ion channel family protein n=1 Tax=Rhodohalobacter sp. SW132 TaxID=2293433 RepID=UPI000E2470CD|nr:mechanosensitive ion channel family protein [Rhodohalobacter sp. SW132]REL33600.1 mechanosensitive ion channel family protein [Rhodohalobacter sp. SW132]